MVFCAKLPRTTSTLAKPLGECIVIVQGPHSGPSFQHASCLLLKRTHKMSVAGKEMFCLPMWSNVSWIMSRRSPKFMKHLYSVGPALCCSLTLLPGPTCCIKCFSFLCCHCRWLQGSHWGSGVLYETVSWQASLFGVHLGKLPRLSCKVSSGNSSGIYEAWRTCANEQMDCWKGD